MPQGPTPASFFSRLSKLSSGLSIGRPDIGHACHAGLRTRRRPHFFSPVSISTTRHVTFRINRSEYRGRPYKNIIDGRTAAALSLVLPVFFPSGRPRT